MGEVKQINIKNRTYYFYNNMINLKNFEPKFKYYKHTKCLAQKLSVLEAAFI